MARTLRLKSSLKSAFIAFRQTDKEIKRINDMSQRLQMSRSQFMSRAVTDALDRIDSKSETPKGRTFIGVCRYILGK